jgi:hydroxymethylpyrimidine/phosphomethylpyrimidine kinase
MIVEDLHGMERAAAALRETGAETVIITGGHMSGHAVDVFYDGKEMLRLSAKKIPGAFHGTGCVFSAAITALLALGADARGAAEGAKEFTVKAITGAYKTGSGMRVLDI